MNNDFPLIFDFLNEIQYMHRELKYLREEVKRLQDIEKKYNQFVERTIENGQKTMANWIDVLLSDKITINTN